MFAVLIRRCLSFGVLNVNRSLQKTVLDIVGSVLGGSHLLDTATPCCGIKSRLSMPYTLRRFIPSRFYSSKESSLRKTPECQRKRETGARDGLNTEEKPAPGAYMDLDAWRKEDYNFVDKEDTSCHSIWFLIDARWLDTWKTFATQQGPLPGPIDNSSLLDEFGELRPDAQVAIDYRGINSKVWEFFQKRYGGGPTISRPSPDKRTLKGASSRTSSTRSTPVRHMKDGPDCSNITVEPCERSASASRLNAPGKSFAASVPFVSEDSLTTTGKNISDSKKASRRGLSVPAHRVDSERDAPSSRLCCDKCDGPHETNKCPFFKKPREKHKDAWTGLGKSREISDSGNAPILKHARIVPQPGDGSCLFHSLSYGLSDHSSGQSLRYEVSRFINQNGDVEIGDTTIKEWIYYDSGGSCESYVRRLERGTWGGGIEMAAITKMKNVSVHVYEECSEGFRRISAFESPGARKIVKVLYRGRMHYDALV